MVLCLLADTTPDGWFRPKPRIRQAMRGRRIEELNLKNRGNGHKPRTVIKNASAISNSPSSASRYVAMILNVD
jgi:hypothetical protein